MDPQLIITLGGNVFFAALMLVMGIAVYLHDRKRKENILFFCLTLSTALFGIGFVVAPLMPTYELAYAVWMFNLVDVFITISVVHFILKTVDKDVQYRWYILFTYTSAFMILLVGILFPHLFLPTVEAKMYFPYYLVAGPWYTVMLVYFFALPVLPFVELVKKYFTESAGRARSEYFIFMLGLGYAFGSIDFFLVYGIEIDPFFGMFLGLYLIPVAYGIVEQDLLDIRVVLWRAVLYSVGIAVSAGFLTVLIFLNAKIVEWFPYLEFWTIPLIAATGAFVMGRTMWHQIKESERLKYEFVTVAAHKLRTPLTRIRWQLESLFAIANTEELKAGVLNIEHANTQLIELTNILLDTAHTEDSSYRYQWKRADFFAMAKTATERFRLTALEREITLSITGEVVYVLADEHRLSSALEVLIENAVMYSPKGGAVTVKVGNERGQALFSVQDMGIGIEKADLGRIFTKFFRTDSAKLVDTEGVGLGLAISKSVVEKHRGRLWVESAGKGKGSTFYAALPIEK